MNSEAKSTLKERIRLCAKMAGSGDELARRTGIPRRTMENYLSGRSEPKISAVAAIARAAGVSVDWLATGEEGSSTGGALAEATAKGVPTGNLDGSFVLIPRYNVEASAGDGAFTDNEQILDYMAFRREWVRRHLGVDPKRLVLITAIGDSMEPTIRAGDLLLVDTAVECVLDDAIYVIVKAGRLAVKRLQQFMTGEVAVKSDNAAYDPETIRPGELGQLRVAGRVRWIARVV